MSGGVGLAITKYLRGRNTGHTLNFDKTIAIAGNRHGGTQGVEKIFDHFYLFCRSGIAALVCGQGFEQATKGDEYLQSK